MSNTENDPKETICVEDCQGEHFLELIEPRDVPLGGVRAMTVRRTIPQKKRTLIGAWCFLDHYGPDPVNATGGMNVPAHPHTGLQTASWLFSGEIEHRDSAGFHALVRPGELNLMTAGSGISHSERSTAKTTSLHGVQLWIALPDETRHTQKTFEHYVPETLSFSGGHAQVFLGELLEQKSPVKTFSEIVGAEINLAANAEITLKVNPAFEHGILVDSGGISVAAGIKKSAIAKNELLYSSPGVSEITLTTADAPTKIVFIGGLPFGEQIVMWWNFIGRDHDEIAAYRKAWQEEIGGPLDPRQSGPDVRKASARETVTSEPSAAERFGLPANEPEPPLPAPVLPLTKLLPRK